MRKSTFRSAAAMLCVFTMLVTTLDARVEIKPGFNAFSPEQDVELGKQAQQEVVRQMPIVNDAQLNAYITRLGMKLVSFAPGHKYPYSFGVVNDKQINAFALPGGPIYVHTGTIAAAANEAQLAGVLAHEISHVALRHSTNQASKAMLAQAPLAILGGVFSGGLGQLAQLGIGFGLNSVFMKFSRSAERQADDLGSQIMYDAGYDPRGMAQFFETIQKQGGGGTIEFLSSHPNPGNRIQDVQKLIPQLGPSKNFTNDSPDFQQARQRVAGIRPASPSQNAQLGGSQTQGGVQPPPSPSRTMQGFDAGFFSIQYPNNWQVYGQGTGAVTVVPPGGVLGGGNGGAPEIAYGILSSIYEPQQTGRQMNIQQATQQLLNQLAQSNPHMQVDSRSQRSIRIGGQSGMSVTARGQSPTGGAEVDWIVTSSHPEGLWYIIFIAPERDWNSYRSVFEQMLSSVRLPR